MKLLKPTLKYAQSWREGIDEFEAEGVRGFWNVPEKPLSAEDYIERIEAHSQGKNLPDYWVPASTFWLVDDDEFVGHVNIRHELTDKLKEVGGHVGYAIRPFCRGKGYGTKILELALVEAGKLGLNRVMLTCDDENIPSIKIIEKNEGVLDKKVEVDQEHHQGLVRHYWIEL